MIANHPDVHTDFLYIPNVLSAAAAQRHLEALIVETPFVTKYTNIYGRKALPRLMRWYGPHTYRYGRIAWEPLDLTPRLNTLRQSRRRPRASPTTASLRACTATAPITSASTATTCRATARCRASPS